ncbi:MAG: hypothetical protein J6B77_07890 [Clostridia bacterium]|nr:hypothetical protein [Clostridia bacterium]
MYKTELHCHTAEVSDCGQVSARVLTKSYVEHGYTTVVLTNHLSKFTYKNSRFDHSDWSWKQKIDFYMDGFHRFEETAAGKLHVILGCELRSNLDNNDYLLYGVTEDFLRSLPDMMDERLVVVREELHSIGGLIYQAHPFRDTMTVKRPARLDGIEVFNACNRGFRNVIADQWAEHYGLLKSSGSDFHATYQTICGGIETEAPITCREELVASLRDPSVRLLGDPYEKLD